MKAISTIALILVIVVALNWGLVGAAKFDLIEAILGDMSVLSRIVYVLVGIAGLYCLSLIHKAVMGKPTPA